MMGPHCLISEEEVTAAIKGLKIGKAAGPTGVVSEMMKASHSPGLQTTQPTSGRAVTEDSSCCAICVEPPHPRNGGPIYRFWGMQAMRSRWMAGAVAHKSG